ncbi:alpha beta-hydrolase [Trichoderma arundinaceum]|uniref:Alpha beta-hydrolase n=1 Tax=Trichoderma arundinaceum TaxID=490622 RepID=A0A395NF87_TRIAR|nr:alpha beta-hydrolase [Trichoderma arundinaceum]
MSIRSLLQIFSAALAVTAQQPFKAQFGSQPAPFEIQVDPSFIEETRIKASLTRIATDLVQRDSHDGPAVQNVTAIKNYWTNHYNWTTVQSRLNEHLPQFTTTVSGAGNYSHDIPLHFVHRQSSRKDAIPLLFIHGYPGSFMEVDRVIDGYTNPPENETAFHVVAPSLPGFGFSPAPEYPGLGLRESGQAFHKLMKQLGYDKYIIHGGDLGSHTLRYMALDHPTSVRAIHTNLWFQVPTKEDMERFNAKQSTNEEAFLINVLATFTLTLLGQRQVFENQPLQWAYAMTDSPVGHAAWVLFELLAGSPSYPWTADEIITWTMMLQIQGPFGSARMYKELSSRGQRPWAGKFGYIHQPVGITQFAEQGFITPENWARRQGNIVFFNHYPYGGHFASWEVPGELVADLREFIKPGTLAWNAYQE